MCVCVCVYDVCGVCVCVFLVRSLILGTSWRLRDECVRRGGGGVRGERELWAGNAGIMLCLEHDLLQCQQRSTDTRERLKINAVVMVLTTQPDVT